MSESNAVQNMHNMVQYWTSIQPKQNVKRSLDKVETSSLTENRVRRKVKVKRSVPNIQGASHTVASDCSKF